MALPILRSVGAKSAATTGAGSIVNPSGISVGDLDIMIAASGSTGCAITSDGGTPWALLAGPVTVTGGALTIWWRIIQAGDTFPQLQDAVSRCVCRIAYQAGTFDSVTPFEIVASGSEATSDTSFSWAPGTSTADIDRLVLCVATSTAVTNTGQVPVMTNAALSALVSRVNIQTLNTGGGGFGLTEGALAIAGAVGTFACTYVGASRKAYISFAIRPFIAAPVYTDAPSGGIVLGGSVAQDKVYDDVESGALALGGSAASSKVLDSSPTGGIVLGGSVALSKLFSSSPAGGIVLGGSAALAWTRASTPTSGIVLGGSVALSRTYTAAPSAGVVLNGSCSSSLFTGTAYFDTPSGGVVLGGSQTSARSLALTCSAGLVLGGAQTSTRTLALAPSAGLVLGGTCSSSLITPTVAAPVGGIVLGGSVVTAVLTWAYPVSDLLDGNWTDQAGGHNLWDAIDEVTADDADYIVSPVSPSPADICQVQFSPLEDPTSSVGHALVYRYGSETDAFVTVTQTLSAAQADAITDYTALSVKFEAVS